MILGLHTVNDDIARGADKVLVAYSTRCLLRVGRPVGPPWLRLVDFCGHGGHFH